MSRNTFIYTTMTLATVGLAAIGLQSIFTRLLESEQSARIITLMIVAFITGALAAIMAVYLGAALRPLSAKQTEQTPRRVFVPLPRQFTPAGTSSADTAQMLYSSPEDTPTTIIQDGVARLMDEPARSKNNGVIEWAELDPQNNRAVVRSIDVQTLRRFARLHTPSRSEWSGRATTYSAALAFFRYIGWVMPATIGNGVEWGFIHKKLPRRLAHLGDLSSLSQLSQHAPTHPALNAQLLPHPN